jgi:hypothetical protein
MMQRWHDNAWARRATFSGTNLAVGLVIILLGIEPTRELLARRDAQIAEQRLTLARLRALAAQEATVDAAARQAPADTDEYLTGSNEGVLNADLQTRLKSLVEPAGAQVRAVRILSPQTADGVRYVGSRIEIHGPLAALHRAIASLEAGKPYLFIRAAVIKPAPSAGARNAVQEPVFDAQLDIFGAVRIAGAKP